MTRMSLGKRRAPIATAATTKPALRPLGSTIWTSGAINALRERSGIGTSDISFFDVGIKFFWHLPDIPTDPAAIAEFEAGKRLTLEEAIDLALAKSPVTVPT